MWIPFLGLRYTSPKWHALGSPTSKGARIIWHFTQLGMSFVCVCREIHWPARWLHGSQLEKWAAVIQTAVAALPRRSFFCFVLFWGGNPAREEPVSKSSWWPAVAALYVTLQRSLIGIISGPTAITKWKNLSKFKLSARFCYQLSIYSLMLHAVNLKWHRAKHIGLVLHLLQFLSGGIQQCFQTNPIQSTSFTWQHNTKE